MFHPSARRPEPPAEQYLARLHRALVRLLVGHRPPADADDIATQVVTDLFARGGGALAEVMAAHPDPTAYARLVARRASIAFDRRQRVQRGEGTRLRSGADGTVGPARRVVSVDAASGGGAALLATRPAEGAEPHDDGVVTRLDAGAELRHCLLGLTPADRRLLLMVDGYGWSVTEVAARLGVRRETVSRRLARIRRAVRAAARRPRPEAGVAS